MRFRHKLTIMLVVLALVPLVASGLLAASLIHRNQVTHVDGRLGGVVSSGLVAYGDALRGVQLRAVALAHRKDVQDALAGKGDPARRGGGRRQPADPAGVRRPGDRRHPAARARLEGAGQRRGRPPPATA